MSFAHDIVMCNDTITTTQPKDVKNSVQQINQPSLKSETTVPKPIAAGNKIPANNQQMTQANLQNHLLHSQTTTERDYKDPLRELVLISEAICINDTAYLTNVKSLAKEASVLEHVKEVLPEQAGQMPVRSQPFDKRYTMNMISLAGTAAIFSLRPRPSFVDFFPEFSRILFFFL